MGRASGSSVGGFTDLSTCGGGFAARAPSGRAPPRARPEANGRTARDEQRSYAALVAQQPEWGAGLAGDIYAPRPGRIDWENIGIQRAEGRERHALEQAEYRSRRDMRAELSAHLIAAERRQLPGLARAHWRRRALALGIEEQEERAYLLRAELVRRRFREIFIGEEGLARVRISAAENRKRAEAAWPRQWRAMGDMQERYTSGVIRTVISEGQGRRGILAELGAAWDRITESAHESREAAFEAAIRETYSPPRQANRAAPHPAEGLSPAPPPRLPRCAGTKAGRGTLSARQRIAAYKDGWARLQSASERYRKSELTRVLLSAGGDGPGSPHFLRESSLAAYEAAIGRPISTELGTPGRQPHYDEEGSPRHQQYVAAWAPGAPPTPPSRYWAYRPPTPPYVRPVSAATHRSAATAPAAPLTTPRCVPAPGGHTPEPPRAPRTAPLGARGRRVDAGRLLVRERDGRCAAELAEAAERGELCLGIRRDELQLLTALETPRPVWRTAEEHACAAQRSPERDRGAGEYLALTRRKLAALGAAPAQEGPKPRLAAGCGSLLSKPQGREAGPPARPAPQPQPERPPQPRQQPPPQPGPPAQPPCGRGESSAAVRGSSPTPPRVPGTPPVPQRSPRSERPGGEAQSASPDARDARPLDDGSPRAEQQQQQQQEAADEADLRCLSGLAADGCEGAARLMEIARSPPQRPAPENAGAASLIELTQCTAPRRQEQLLETIIDSASGAPAQAQQPPQQPPQQRQKQQQLSLGPSPDPKGPEPSPLQLCLSPRSLQQKMPELPTPVRTRHKAAIAIQCCQRQHAARAAVRRSQGAVCAELARQRESDAAAAAIQRAQRGSAARAAVGRRQSALQQMREAEQRRDSAAGAIQHAQRGHAARAERERRSSAVSEAKRRDSAAVTIQTAQRGRAARAELERRQSAVAELVAADQGGDAPHSGATPLVLELAGPAVPPARQRELLEQLIALGAGAGATPALAALAKAATPEEQQELLGQIIAEKAAGSSAVRTGATPALVELANGTAGPERQEELMVQILAAAQQLAEAEAARTRTGATPALVELACGAEPERQEELMLQVLTAAQRLQEAEAPQPLQPTVSVEPAAPGSAAPPASPQQGRGAGNTLGVAGAGNPLCSPCPTPLMPGGSQAALSAMSDRGSSVAPAPSEASEGLGSR
eukprot:TRINITY_DN4942_c0_g2_i2.p1 TRINITY_DN4942_c0_g2~~TRINITY_DN4942_c0_g2_i2.p1  ORF type:complete len:1209 (+),score=314.57 TRINITY_DN4942_c0_g2_i2:85-3627(+)